MRVLTLYDHHEPFVEDCVATRQAIEGLPEVDRRAAIRELAHRWNLHLIPDVAHWQFSWLEQGLKYAGEIVLGVKHAGELREENRLGPFAFVSTMQLAAPRQVTYRDRRWEMRQTETLGAFRARIVSGLRVRARSLPEEVVAQLNVLDSSDGSLSDAHPGGDSHAERLFWRLCPGAFDGESMESPTDGAIADRLIALPSSAREHIDVDDRAVRRSVTAIAKRLSITMPSRPPGRPRNRSQS